MARRKSTAEKLYPAPQTDAGNGVQSVASPGANSLVDARPPKVANQNDMRVVELRQECDQRVASLETVRWTWWTHWRELAHYTIPRLARFLETPNENTRGRQMNRRIIDNTALIAAQRCAAGLLSGVASPARPWFQLSVAGFKTQVDDSSKKWLDDLQKRMLAILAGSNFYRSMGTLFEEVSVFGTAAMLMYEDYEDVIRYYPKATGEYYLAVDERLEVNTFAEKIVMTVQEVVGNFGLENCSANVCDMYTRGFMDQELMVGHIIMPNDNRVYDAMGARGMPWLDVYWEWGCGANMLLREKGHHEKPFCAPRWSVTGNDAYGRGPGMDAYGDNRQLQTTQKRKAQVIDKTANPPMIADSVLKNEPATTIPGGVTFVPSNAKDVAFKPAYQINPGAIGEVREDIAECQQRIKTAFFEDLFLMISQYDVKSGITATEIAERKEEKMLMLGPVLERLHDEALKVVVLRLFGIMSRNKLLPPDPPQEIQGREIGIEFISTLAQAQKAVATTSIERMAGFVGNLAGPVPGALDKIDWDEAIDEYGDALGVPAKLIVPTDKAVAMRAQKAQAAQSQMSAQNSLPATQAALNLSKIDVGGGQNAVQRMLGTGP